MNQLSFFKTKSSIILEQIKMCSSRNRRINGGKYKIVECISALYDMKKLTFRSVLVPYSTNIPGKGWDGRIDGILQAPGTFVWVIKAIDYNGSSYFNKGTVTLIR
jgi:hypothetical protein